MGTERVTADVTIIPQIIHIIREEPKKESKGTARPLGESIGQSFRPSINGSSQMIFRWKTHLEMLTVDLPSGAKRS